MREETKNKTLKIIYNLFSIKIDFKIDFITARVALMMMCYMEL